MKLARCPRAAAGPRCSPAAHHVLSIATRSFCPKTAQAGYLASEGVVDKTGCAPAGSPFRLFRRG